MASIRINKALTNNGSLPRVGGVGVVHHRTVRGTRRLRGFPA
jgi:hypothetical protein